jgi:Tfp pilus assembly protein PilZ
MEGKMPQWNFQEKRKFTRFEANLPLKNAQRNTVKEINGYTHDLSSQGIGMFAKEGLSIGTQLDIRLFMPDNGEELRTSGRVVWLVKVEAEKYRVGIELNNTDLKPIPLVLRTIRMRTRYYY